MKTKTTLYIICAFCIMLVCACAASETEQLKQARALQNETLKSLNQLDTSLAAYTNRLSGEISAMSTDTMLQLDTVLFKNYNALKNKLEQANSAHTDLVNWKSQMKLLPTPEEIAKGATNPFGEGKTDEDALSGMEKQYEEYNAMSKKVSELIHQ